MEKIALFGGMFDPVHSGHLYAAKKAAEKLKLDRVIFIPANKPPHKTNGCYASGRHRLAMLRLALAGEEHMEVSDYEITREEISYSYITAEHFAAIYPAAKLYFLIGDEAYAEISTWKMPERIRAVASFAVVTREGGMVPKDAVYVKVPKFLASSTEVRHCLQTGEAVHALLPTAVEDYIIQNGLYR